MFYDWDSINRQRADEKRRLLKAHTLCERKLDKLLRELRHSMPSEREAIKADVKREQQDLEQLRDQLRMIEEGRAA